MVKQTTWNKATGSVTIPGRSVAVLLDDQAPDPVKTTVLAAPNKLLAKAGSAVKVVGKVIAADRSNPVGTVTVTDNGKVIATETLKAGDKGRIDVKLPKLGKGLHLIRTSFTGEEPYEDSRSIPLPVLLW